jgi:hypothetical protein
MPGVELQLNYVTAKGPVSVSGFRLLQITEPSFHSVHEEGLAGSPVAKETQGKGWFYILGGQDRAQRDDLTLDAQ